MHGHTTPRRDDPSMQLPERFFPNPPKGRSESLNLGQRGLGEDGIRVTPLPGFHFSMCSPRQQSTPLRNRIYCDAPAIVAIVLLDGVCTYSISGEDESAYTIQKSMSLVGKWTNEEIEITIPAQNAYSYASFIIQESALEEFFGRGLSADVQRILRRSLENGTGRSNTITGIAKPDVIVTALQILDMGHKLGDDSLRCRCAVFNLFAKLFQGITDVEQGPNIFLPQKDIEQLSALKTIIEANFRTIESALDACAKIGITFSKANKGFKTLYSITVAKYIQHCKMVYAYSSMQKMRYNVSECAFSIGYSNTSYFISTFKKHFGMTPKALSRLVGKEKP